MTSGSALRLIVTASLAAMLASSAILSANAATKSKRARHAAPAVGAASSCRGANLFPCGPVYNSTDYLGNDPDPFIRSQIQRDLGAKYGGES
jgi:hypothetical protein